MDQSISQNELYSMFSSPGTTGLVGNTSASDSYNLPYYQMPNQIGQSDLLGIMTGQSSQNSTQSGPVDGTLYTPPASTQTASYPQTAATIPTTSSINTGQWGQSFNPTDQPINGPITQDYGSTDFAQGNRQIYASGFHNGIDIGVPTGTTVPETVGGTVVQVGDMGKAAYGKFIVVKGTDGITRLYGHLSRQDVSQGQTVQPGDILGITGSTGDSTGPHLHYSEFKSAN